MQRLAPVVFLPLKTSLDTQVNIVTNELVRKPALPFAVDFVCIRTIGHHLNTVIIFSVKQNGPIWGLYGGASMSSCSLLLTRSVLHPINFVMLLTWVGL